jgi:hypothetical protein
MNMANISSINLQSPDIILVEMFKLVLLVIPAGDMTLMEVPYSLIVFLYRFLSIPNPFRISLILGQR